MKVQKTKDYSMFRKLNGNRALNAGHVKSIMMSMKEHGVLPFILVCNEHNQVIDGQHRLEAMKQLNMNINISYVVREGAGLKEAIAQNSVGSLWNFKAHLDSHCELKNDNYIRLSSTMNNFQEFTYSYVLSVCGKKGSKGKDDTTTRKKFKDGEFVYENQIDVEILLHKIRSLKPYVSFTLTTIFCRAYAMALHAEGFEHTVFLKKLSRQAGKLLQCSTSKQYLQIIEEIYNNRSRGGSIRLF